MENNSLETITQDDVKKGLGKIYLRLCGIWRVLWVKALEKQITKESGEERKQMNEGALIYKEKGLWPWEVEIGVSRLSCKPC